MKEDAGKVLIIDQNLPLPFDRRVWLESKTLTVNGYKVSVISPKSIEFNKSYENIDGISIYRYKMPVKAKGKLSYLFEFAYAWIATAFLSLKVLRHEGFNTIQACNPPDTYFLLAKIYKLFGKNFIFDHHDLSPEMYIAKFNKRNGILFRTLVWLEKLTFKTADVVLSTNEYYKEVAVIRGYKNPQDVFVVRTGPDLEKVKIKLTEPQLKKSRKFMITYLGEMCPQDGVDYLLRSADYLVNTLGRKDVLFTLVGGGPAMESLKAMGQKMGLADFVVFTGRVPDEDLSRYLSTATVCVDPNPYSEWADHSTMNKILDYMAFAKPIVSFDLTETKNSAQEAAVYIIPNDIKKFAEAISELLDDPTKRKAMGQFGRQRVVNELSWSHTHKDLLKAYRKVTKLPGPPKQ